MENRSTGKKEMVILISSNRGAIAKLNYFQNMLKCYLRDARYSKLADKI